MQTSTPASPARMKVARPVRAYACSTDEICPSIPFFHCLSSNTLKQWPGCLKE